MGNNVSPRLVPHGDGTTRQEIFAENQTIKAIKLLTNLEENFPHISKIEAKNCSITEIPISVGKLTDLQHLALPLNKIKEVPKSLEQCGKLRKLNLSGNKIVDFPAVICCLKSLEKLDLSNNRLQNMVLLNQDADLVANLTTLPIQEIDMQANIMNAFPVQFCLIKTLVKLDFSNNKISTLPPEIKALVHLQELKLVNNSLASITPELRHCTSIH
jgi:Leucine-rich repeat (LRR) protein